MSEDNTGFRFPTSRIPYPERKGLSVWPNGARMAVLIYTAPEQWNWGVSELMDPMATWRYGEKLLPQSTRSAVEYGFNVGLHRIRDLFNEFNMKTTLWTNGNTIEQYRDIMELLVADGHELGGHGYSEGTPMSVMDRAGQDESIKRTVELLSSVADRPRGWVGPGAAADRNTVELLVENGFDYHADFQDDELPYFLHAAGKTIVEIPYRMVGNLNDLPLQTVLAGTPKSVRGIIEHLHDAFDAYYKAAETHPLILNYGTHPYVSGRPDGFAALRDFVEYVHSHDDVWVCSYAEMADWWREQYGDLVPPDGGDIDVSALARN